MRKLSPTMERALEKLQPWWMSAYKLDERIPTLDALVVRGLAERKQRTGRIFAPSVSTEYCLSEEARSNVTKKAGITIDPIPLGLARGVTGWTQGDYLLYYAYVVYKLNSWKFEAIAQLHKDGHDELMMKHPCGIDGLAALTDAIKIAKPELYNKDKSIGWHSEQVKDCLWPKKGSENE